MNIDASLDWLQLRTYTTLPIDSIESDFLDIDKLEYSTRNFKSIHEIYQGNNKVATIASEPQSTALHERLALLKIENNLLYDSDISLIVEQILEALQLEFQGISRIDIANDFNRFDLRIKPENFINRFFNSEYLKREKVNFNIRGKQGTKTTPTYLAFGSKLSDINYYLYNKTKEMENVKYKPWINEKWIEQKLDKSEDIWRLEFSLKANKNTLVNLETGELINLNSLEVINHEILNSLYCALIDKYFQFVKNDGKSRKDRMKPVRLLNTSSKSHTILKISDKKESTRSDKIFIKKMYQYNQELRGSDFFGAIESKANLKKFIESRNLESWVARKHPNIFEEILIE